MTKAMYAFSADPIHYGHINAIERAARVFDEVIVGIGVNPDKKYLFTLAERVEMAEKALADLPTVKVVPFQGLLVDYAAEQGVDVIVKGVRDTPDFNYEILLHQVGESQRLGIDTFFLPARRDLSHMSSSVIKALQKEQGSIQDYVPLAVKQALEERISHQYVLGIMGEMGAGKSYVGGVLASLAESKGIVLHNIELDHLGHRILSTLPEPLYEQLREQIVEKFGSAVRAADGSIDRKVLGEVVFNDRLALASLNNLMRTSLSVCLRREMQGKEGLILLNSALLAETKMNYLCNNNVILVTADRQSQERRLGQRGLTAEQIQRRLASQYSSAEKQRIIEEDIGKSHHGMLWKITNSDGSDQTVINSVLDDVIVNLGVK